MTPWWEIEGMVESPEGEENWFALYQAQDKTEAVRMLTVVLSQEDLPQHERFEDFRVAPPNDPRTEQEAIEDRRAYIVMGTPRRRRRRAA